MARTICGFSPGVFFALVVFVCGRTLFHLTAFKDVSKLSSMQQDPKQCRNLANTAVTHPSCEDFRFISEDIIITGSGDITHFIDHGNDSPGTKTLVAIDLRTEKTKELTVSIPGVTVFRPHGLAVKGNRLFVVNHAQNLLDRVEVFEFKVTNNDLNSVSIAWVQSIIPPVPKGALNSVTAVSDTEIYVTHHFGMDMPEHGVMHPRSLSEVQSTLHYLFSLLGGKGFTLSPAVFGRTHVYRCLLDANTCEIVSPRFTASNGITSTSDGKLIFVVDCVRQIVTVFSRDTAGSGKLAMRTVIPTPHDLDNIMVANTPPRKDGKIELWVGTMPELMHYSFGKKNIRGGLVTILYDPATNEGEVEDTFIHDGTVVSGVATAAVWKNKVILSGPKPTGGLAICDL